MFFLIKSYFFIFKFRSYYIPATVDDLSDYGVRDYVCSCWMRGNAARYSTLKADIYSCLQGRQATLISSPFHLPPVSRGAF